MKVAAFAIGAALAGLSGALYAHTFSFIEAQNFNALLSIYVLLYVLLGGTQTAWGPIAGVAFFTLLPELMRDSLPAMQSFVLNAVGISGSFNPPDESWRFVLLGVLTVLMMVFRPEGLITRTMIDRIRFRRPAAVREEAVE